MKTQTTGTAESLRILELVLKKGSGVVIHNGEYGRDYMTNINTQRKSFARVWHVRVNGGFAKLRFWYENRDCSYLKGFGNVSGSPNNFSLLSENYPAFKMALKKVVDSVNVPIQEDKDVAQAK